MRTPVKKNIAGYRDNFGMFHPIRSPKFVGSTKRKATPKDRKAYSKKLAGDLDDVFDREIRKERNRKKADKLFEDRLMRQLEREAYGTRSGGRLAQSLVEFVRSEGGIRRTYKFGGKKLRGKKVSYDAGELAPFTYKESGKRGLVTDKGGKTLDGMFQAAREAGYPVSDENDLLDRMDEEIRGNGATYATHGYLDYRDNPGTKKCTTARRNPMHPVSAFAAGTSGILSALQIREMVKKHRRPKSKKTNPAWPKETQSAARKRFGELLKQVRDFPSRDVVGSASSLIAYFASTRKGQEAAKRRLRSAIEAGSKRHPSASGAKKANPKKPSAGKKNPLRVKLYKFYVGQKLATRFIGDHDLILRAEVLSRTPKFVTIKVEGERGTKRCGISKWGDSEVIFPDGRYSMAPSFTAKEGSDRLAPNPARKSPKRKPSRRKLARKTARKKPKAKRANPAKVPHRRTFEMFQGRQATTARQLAVSGHAPKHLDQLGDLIELKLNSGKVLKFAGKKFKLCAAGGKLWIAGGRFAKANPAGKAREVNPIDAIDHVVYGTYKPHHGDMQYTHYIHKLGEETGHMPTLCVDRQGYPIIRGGRYKIEARGIVN